jgi:membrane protease YdiL (CAAX protease family)
MGRMLRKIFVSNQGEVRSGWKALGFVAVAFAVIRVFQLAVRPILPFLRAHRDAIPEPLVLGLFVLIASWICVRLEKGRLPNLGLRLDGRWWRGAFRGAGLGMGLILLSALIVLAMGGFHWERDAAATLRGLLAGAWLYVGVALSEELLFRGYVFQRLIKGMGEWPAQILLALLFAAAHWGNPGMSGATKVWATLNIALAAVMLGLAYVKSGSLALPMGLHFGWNWAQGNLLGFGVSGTTSQPGLLHPVFHSRPEWLTGGAFGLEASLPATFVLIGCCVWMARWKAPVEDNALQSLALPSEA